MGRDHTAVLAAPAKKKGKADTSPALANGKPNLPLGATSPSIGKTCLPLGSPVSGASTAASTPTFGFNSPKSSSISFEPLDLGQSMLTMDAQEEVGCFVCGEANLLISYVCENPHRNHSFSVCLQRCSKKFEKECARLCDTKKKQSFKHTDPINCPRCRFSIKHEMKSSMIRDDTESVPNGTALLPAPVKAFVSADLLPPKKEGRQSKNAAVLEKKPVTVAVPKLVQCIEELSFQVEYVEDEASKLELKEAQSLVNATNHEIEQLQKQLALLSGKTNRKERNEMNRRIFILENQADVLAAKRLVRDPMAEHQRRCHEARALEEKAKKHMEMQKVVRARLDDALKESGTTKVCAFPWEQLLMEGKTAGLSDDEETMIEVKKQVDVLQKMERQRQEKIAEQERQAALEEAARQERLETAAAAHKYVLRLMRRVANSLAGDEYRKQGKQEKSWKAKKLPWRSTKFTNRKNQRWDNSQSYKTELCRHFATSTCPYGNACFYAHGVEELLPLRKHQPSKHFSAPWRTLAADRASEAQNCP